ncbi:C40 family peptidase [Pseudogulbenkiania ferrooxidans]|uniref:NLP/P60 protein n=1 Tax=Pseudogulbenkiania ferrooxidans 2002 TaxID=279714 RepID=B9Z2J8_9NEIS|nr:C40 family peptidase [Pseudogulbenkiania ferrooxidans]EEG08801.1 NLP/P60 protein [Pseudogulbenkiania ferrooxidans 2002]
MTSRRISALIVAVVAAALAACSSAPPRKTAGSRPRPPASPTLSGLTADGAGREILMYTLGLLDLDYRFGGSNPEAGLDCSGLVSYIYQNAVGVKLPHNAAQIASVARPIEAGRMQVGDLVFFNTMNRPFSHMGIYIGDGKFVHAPRSNSTIRVERLDNRYFAARFEGARTLFD